MKFLILLLAACCVGQGLAGLTVEADRLAKDYWKTVSNETVKGFAELVRQQLPSATLTEGSYTILEIRNAQIGYPRLGIDYKFTLDVQCTSESDLGVPRILVSVFNFSVKTSIKRYCCKIYIFVFIHLMAN